MPNGWDRNWIRFAITIRGFKGTFGEWPSRVVAVQPMTVESIERLFAPQTFLLLTQRMTFEDSPDLDGEPWDGYFYAEADDGRRLTYGDALHGRQASEREINDWLWDIHPDAPHA